MNSHLPGRLRAEIGRFAAERGGGVAIIFSLTLLPVLFLAGAAVDYSNASNLRAKLQSATDGANLQLCLMPGSPTQSQLDAAAQTYMQGYMADKPFTVDAVIATTGPRQIELRTRAIYATAIVRAVNTTFATLPVTAQSKCFGEPGTFEIALALDNTGSMLNSSGGVSKMEAMRTAAKNFVNAIYADPKMGPNTKMSIVPFAAAVALSPSTPRNSSWIDSTGKASYHWSFIQGGAVTAALFAGPPYNIKSRFDVIDRLKSVVPAWGDWGGCFESLPFPLNTQDGVPTTGNLDSYYVPMFAPDEWGNGGEATYANSYLNDTGTSCTGSTDAQHTGQACKYVAMNNPVSTGVGPNTLCTSRPLTRLTNSQTTLINELNAMAANGATNIHEGFMWGWRTISPNSVLADGAVYGKPYNHKVVVLMTDGFNTWNARASPITKSTYSAYGFFKNPDGLTTGNTRIPAANANPTTTAHGRAAMDALTVQGCQNARNAGVTIYTVGFSVTGDLIDQQGLDMLTACAGNASRAFTAHDSSSIDNVFQLIAQDIGRLRLSM